MDEVYTVVFTDGAAKGNPGPGGWGAIVVTQPGEVTELGGSAAHTTNNKMELAGAIHALEHLRNVPGLVEIRTDSSYVVQGITQWIHGWRRNGWKTKSGGEVLNRDLWQKLAALVQERGRDNAVRWRHIRGHAGIAGNERADQIAVTFSNGGTELLFRGRLDHYGVPILDMPAATPQRSTPSRRSNSKGKPYSYLSLIGGEPQRHATWADCERRVKGKPGARFKKAMSAEEETEILKSWGLTGGELSR